MEFCGNKTPLSQAWLDHGFSHCFLDTVASSILFGLMAIFGTFTLIIYKRFSTPVDARIKPQSCFFGFQIFLSVLLSVQYVVKFGLQTKYVEPKNIYVYMILSTVFYTIAWPISVWIICLERRRQLPSMPTRGHGLLVLLFYTIAFANENLAFLSWFSPSWWWINRNSLDKQMGLGLWIFRYICTGLVFIIGLCAPGTPEWSRRNALDEEQQEPLLGRTDEASSTWAGVYRKLMALWPYMWPKKSIPLQIRVVFCMFLLGIGRVVNLLNPIWYKEIVDSLTIEHSKATLEVELEEGYRVRVGKLQFRWDLILVYVFLRFLQGGGFGTMGFLNNLRSFLWIRVQQYTTKEIEVRLYAHLHGLSLRWHLGRKTGEVLRVMDRGTTSINNLLSYIVFNIAPTILDIIIAVIYFLTAFSAWFALIVFVTMVLYLVATIWITEWRTKYRREMNKLDNDRNAKGVDSLLNFETVKYYGAEEFEVNRYAEAVSKYQEAEWKSTASLNILNSMQNVIISGGLLAGCLLCAWYVVDRKGLTVGDYVLFSTYIVQLYAPLNWFGTYYRMIQQAFIDMENMFDLLAEKQEVKDVLSAPNMDVSKGIIEFNDVSFHYNPSKPILKNITFVVPPGQTFALVGPSGGGKSTIIRLLFRFYDIQSGCIRIDGVDISKVKQSSLRQAIGVVPQDTVLFNNDIRYNVRYGRVGASDEDLHDAARAADIHERILGFPDGYDTLVGERGLKLSGGEKQRVAIARTLLKAPAIVLLDEATSALDTQTERNIQASLAKVCENRTTLVVAHRLSTIIGADQIMVLKDGAIVERGTHEELLAEEGMYADMWQQQQSKADEETTDSDEKPQGTSKQHTETSKPE